MDVEERLREIERRIERLERKVSEIFNFLHSRIVELEVNMKEI